MKVFKYIERKVKEGPFHFTLLDPEKQSVEEIVKIVLVAFEA